MIFILILATAGILAAAESGRETPVAACRAGGFQVIRFGNGVEASAKADRRFQVSFDAANYNGNGFDSALRAAMTSWSAVSGSNWRYSFSGYRSAAPSPSDGEMTIVSGGYSFPSGVLATTLLSAIASTGEILDADIFFNPAMSFSGGSGSGAFDFHSVALHELGHGLGLDHNDGCYATRTVMQSAIAPGYQERNLLAPELEGVRYLYGSGGGLGGPPGVTASPSSLIFRGESGNVPPAAQTIVLNGSTGTSWQAAASTSSGYNWLSLSPPAGTAPGVLTIRPSTNGLPAGIYFGAVTVNSAGSSSLVSVSLELSPPPTPVLELRPAMGNFFALAGETAWISQTFSLTGSSGLSWRATATTSSGGDWLRVSPANGAVPAVLTVSASAAGLEPGIYAGTASVVAGAIARQITVRLEVAAAPRLMVEPGQISLTTAAGIASPACATLSIRGDGGAALDWTAASGAAWLKATPAAGRSPSSLGLCAAAADLAPGQYATQVTLTATASNTSQNIVVAFTVNPTVRVRDGGVVSAAALAPGKPIAAGEMITIFGADLAPRAAWAAGFPLPAELADCRVLVGGVPARLFYVSPGQINLLVPSALAEQTGSTTTLTVYNGRQASPAVRVTVAQQAPGVFTLLGNGAGAGVLTHADGSLVSREAPVAPGETVVVYLTGIGPLDRVVTDGAPAPADPPARAGSQVRLLVGGQEATVLFAGATPGLAGLQQVVATLPATLFGRFPAMMVEVQGTPSNLFTAGGPSLLDVSPATVRAGAEATVALQGIHLSRSSAVRAAGVTLPAAFTDGDRQLLRVVLPARLLAPGPLELSVIDPEAPAEAASNAVVLRVEP